MTPDRIIVSIPHTGTRFLKERFGIESHVHTHMHWDRILNEIGSKEIISPLREPSDVFISWGRRKNPGTQPFPYGEFFASWFQMHALTLIFNIDFIVVDKQNDPRIEDWSPVGDKDHGNFKHEMPDLRCIHKLPFVEKYIGGASEMIEVAGTWEMGWSAPHTEMTQWWSVMRSYNIPMLHMTPVSGLDHKMLREHTSYDELLNEIKHLTPVFVHEDGETELSDFDHPDDALYVFGKANFSPFVAYGKGELSVRIDCPKMGMLWPHQALAIVLRDRGRP